MRASSPAGDSRRTRGRLGRARGGPVGAYGRRGVAAARGAALLLALLLCSAAAASAAEGDALKLFQEGRHEDARRVSLEALRADPADVESYVVLCWSLLALERWADAENYALKAYAIRKDPRVTEILGESAFRLGKNEAALSRFQDYVSAVPEGSRVGTAYYYMGEIYLRMARYAHADIALSSALKFAPGNARWWARLGWAREKAGESQGALAAYAEALRLDPRQEDARLGAERLQARSRG